MNGFALMLSFWVDGVGLGQVPPVLLGPAQLARVNSRLSGQLVAYDRHCLADRRIWSTALNEHRRMLVYLPPGYDCRKKYPLALFLHGAAQDERFFLQALAIPFDKAIASGKLPPVIIAAPDGSILRHGGLIDVASFWTDSKAGNFEQFAMRDVWDFMHRNYPIRPGRESHALIGVSMGGCAAMTLGIKHRDRVRMVLAVSPLLNVRYSDCRGVYRSSFDPDCVGFQTVYDSRTVLGRRRLFTLRNKNLYCPIFGAGPAAIEGMSRINPLEVMVRENLKPGEMELYVGYGAKDEFNVAAQVQSFAYVAKQRGIELTVDRDPTGGHDVGTGLRLLPHMAEWVSKRVPRTE